MFFALVYVRSKSMWTVIIIHALIDGATFVLYSLLSAEAFKGESGAGTVGGQIFLQSFVVPLITMLPFMMAISFYLRDWFWELLFSLKYENATQSSRKILNVICTFL